MSFSKCATFPLISRLDAARISLLRASHGISCVDKRIIAFALKRKTTRMNGIHAASRFSSTVTIPMIAPQNHVMSRFHSCRLPFVTFSNRGQSCICQHSWFHGMPSEGKFPLLQVCLRGESSTFWKRHFFKKGPSPLLTFWFCYNTHIMRTPYPNLMNLVSIYSEKNILSNTIKINGIQSRMSLKLWLKIVAFLGHPIYYNNVYRRKKNSLYS